MSTRFKRSKTTPNDYINKPSGRTSQLDSTYIGIVKNNIDPQRMGRIQVWVPELGGKEDDENTWYSCNYCAPFGGSQSGASYGMWAPGPALENQVVISFINGDPTRGVYWGILYQQNHNHMVPGVAAGVNPETGRPDLPVLDYDKDEIGKVDIDNIERPVATGMRDTLNNQGLLTDNTRGLSYSSASRESPSRVFGMSTPGSDNQSGHQLVMDDNPEFEHVRLRTKNGAQILLDDTNGIVYIVNRTGKGWMEISENGNIDVFGDGCISIRSELDINLHADRDLNLEGGRNVNIRSANTFDEGDVATAGSVLDEAGDPVGGNINIEGLTDINFTVNRNMNMVAVEKFNIVAEEIHQHSDGDTFHDASGSFHTYAQDNILETADQIHMNSAGSPAVQADPTIASRPVPKQHINILEDNETEQTVSSVTSKFPTYEPYQGHAVGNKDSRRPPTESTSDEVRPGAITSTATNPLPKQTDSGNYEPNGYNDAGEPQWTRVGDSEVAPIGGYRTGPNGLNLIKEFEGWYSQVYLDPIGLPTIGYGHLLTPRENETGIIVIDGVSINVAERGLTKSEGTALLAQDIVVYENGVKRQIDVLLTQNQFDALVSFTFNLGEGKLRSSTLRRKLNTGDYGSVPSELMKWVNAGGRRFDGLVRRRRAEGRLFSGGPTTA